MVSAPSRPRRATWSPGRAGGIARSTPRVTTATRTSVRDSRGRRPAVIAAASRSKVATASGTHEGSGSHDAAAMPIAKAAAGGSSGAAARDRSVTHRDEWADRGQLLRPHAEHVPQGLRRVEAPPALALLDDALGEPRAHSRQASERRRVGVIDVEPPGPGG